MPKSQPAPTPQTRTRARQLGAYTVGPHHHIMTYYPPTVAFDQVYSGKTYWSVEQMVDTVTPGFQQLVADGEIVNKPMWQTSVVYGRLGDTGFESYLMDRGTKRVWSVDKDVAMQYFGSPGPIGLTRLNETNLIHLAQTAALSGVQAPQLQSLVSIRELEQTFKLILNPVRGLVNLFKQAERDYRRDLKRYGNRINGAMKKRTWKQRQKSLEGIKRMHDKRPTTITEKLEFIPEMVLCYNLGWKPTMMDLDALLHTIPALEEEARRTSRAKKRDTATWSETKELQHSSYNKGVFRFTFTEECEVRAGVLYADGFDIAQHFGTRLVDVPEAAWELIPLSFLIDYVVNVGDYLGSLRASSSRQMLAFYTTTTIKTKVEREWLDFLPASPWIASRKPVGVSVVSFTAKTRSPDSFTGSLAFLPLSIGFKAPSHVQNALSLLTTYLMSLRR